MPPTALSNSISDPSTRVKVFFGQSRKEKAEFAGYPHQRIGSIIIFGTKPQEYVSVVIGQNGSGSNGYLAVQGRWQKSSTEGSRDTGQEKLPGDRCFGFTIC